VRFVCVFVLAVAALVSCASHVDRLPRAYVPNERSGTISVIDVSRDVVIATWPAGRRPRGIAASADGRRLFVADQAANSLQVMDSATGAIERQISLGESPEGDGRGLAAASELSNAGLLIDTGRSEVIATIPTEGKNPEHAVFSPDGRWLYVSAEDASQVDVVDVALRRQVASVAVGRRPRGIAFTPDGSRAFVACELDNAVHVIDVVTRRALARIPAGEFANGVVMHPRGHEVFVSNGRGASVSVVDVASRTLVATVPAGQRPWNMAITPDGRKLYVANGRSNSVSIIDTQQRRKVSDVTVGELPWGVVIR
jgi:YVTN family beta-propeller protein